MRKRKKAIKKVNKKARADLHQLLDAVLDINGIQASRVEKTDSHPTAFFYFYGHTGTIGIYVDITGWKPDIKHAAYSASVWQHDELEKVKNYLREVYDGLPS